MDPVRLNSSKLSSPGLAPLPSQPANSEREVLGDSEQKTREAYQKIVRSPKPKRLSWFQEYIPNPKELAQGYWHWQTHVTLSQAIQDAAKGFGAVVALAGGGAAYLAGWILAPEVMILGYLIGAVATVAGCGNGSKSAQECFTKIGGQTLRCEEDIDKDEVMNVEDRCPFQPGVVTNEGCPSSRSPTNGQDGGLSEPEATVRRIGTDVRIINMPGDDGCPSAVWTGNYYGLAWKNETVTNRKGQIYFVYLDASGNKLDNEVRISRTDNFKWCPSLAWTGGGLYGLGWTEEFVPGSSNVIFAQVDHRGRAVHYKVITNYDRGLASYTNIVWTGSEFGVGWSFDHATMGTGISFARLTETGEKIGSDVRVTDQSSNYLGNFSLVWTGSEFGIAWPDRRDGNDEIYFARLSRSGEKLGESVRVTNNFAPSKHSSLSWTGEEYGLAWTDGRARASEKYFTRLSTDGHKIGEDILITDDDGIASGTDDSNPGNLAWTGNEYGVTWVDRWDAGNHKDIYFARLSRDGRKKSTLRVTNDGSRKWVPQLVWTGTEFGLFWEGEFSEGNQIMLTRIEMK